MLDKVIEVEPLHEQFHSADNFREQIAVIWPGALQDGALLAHKTLGAVCQAGLASFDGDSPGEGTWESWQNADAYITAGAVGFYHTHPGSFEWFSGQDFNFIEGLAQANGGQYIWHLMQPCGRSYAHCVCAHMRPRGHVVVYQLGKVVTDPMDTIIVLPMPPNTEDYSDSMSIVHLETK